MVCFDRSDLVGLYAFLSPRGCVNSLKCYFGTRIDRFMANRRHFADVSGLLLTLFGVRLLENEKRETLLQRTFLNSPSDIPPKPEAYKPCKKSLRFDHIVLERNNGCALF